MVLTEFHSMFPGSIRWRVTPRGVECEGSGLAPVSAAARKRAREYLTRYRALYAAASQAYGVPVELLIACSLTESDPAKPETCFREEPGFVSDAETPDRVSAGFCQLLISTAREVVRDPGIDRQWLFNPGNSLRACAAYMKRQAAKTSYDPVYTACAYNAGGLYQNDNPNNRWRLRQYPIGSSKHADRFVEFFNAALELTEQGEMQELACRRYGELLGPSPVRTADAGSGG
ncbi:MAG: lytic transglycosylase domain-containing protein [Acidobacteria bacterium]|nr:lytic transglycosylase domain-containing protein [Acidobacteriota bacterium]